MKIGQHARLVASVVVGLVVAGGTAFATTSDSSGTETAACITPSKYVRILPADTECRSREVAFSLPSMDTIAAVEAVVNENADALDALSASLADYATLSDLGDYATLSDLDSLGAVVDGNGNDIADLRADLAAELDQRTESDADLLDTFDNYYSAADVDGFLAEIYDGFSAVADSLDSKVSGEDLAIYAIDTQSQIQAVADSLEQTGTVIDGLADELLNTIGDLSLSTAAVDAALDARLSSAESRVSSAESTITALVDAINGGIGAAVNGLLETVPAIAADVTALQAKDADLQLSIDGLIAYVQVLDQRNAALEARVAALEAAATPAP